MLIQALALAAVVVSSQSGATPADVTVLDAKIDHCSADFSVRDADGKPVYAALVHVKARYGFLSIKRSDLEVGTSSAGKARMIGLPREARPLVFDIRKGDKHATAMQDVADNCHATFDVSLK